jgi:hypothetical protein
MFITLNIVQLSTFVLLKCGGSTRTTRISRAREQAALWPRHRQLGNNPQESNQADSPGKRRNRSSQVLAATLPVTRRDFFPMSTTAELPRPSCTAQPDYCFVRAPVTDSSDPISMPTSVIWVALVFRCALKPKVSEPFTLLAEPLRYTIAPIT